MSLAFVPSPSSALGMVQKPVIHHEGLKRIHNGHPSRRPFLPDPMNLFCESRAGYIVFVFSNEWLVGAELFRAIAALPDRPNE